MKFARYLQETQTPEWKKAYIDYRGLKKRLTAIRRRQEGIDQENANTSPDDIVESPRSSLSSSDPVPAAPASLKRFDSGSTIQSLHKPLSFENNGNPSSRPPPSTTGPAPPASSRSRFMKLNRRTSLFRGNARNPFPGNFSLQDAKASLTSHEQAFVDALDTELDKIDSFYLTRMREMEQRQQLLSEQLTELAYHKELYSDWKHKTRGIETFLGIPKTSKLPKQKERAKDQTFAANAARFGNLDPEDYANAKKKLKKAVTEHYRVLEMLHNYRVLNLTGFRKALKKFEKTTKIPLMNPYMTECVERAPFAIDRAVKGMMSEIESVFVLQFTGGNRKAAMKNLRGGLAHQTFHFETTSAGLMIGLAIPAFVAGIYLSFREDVREDYPGWGALLYVYGILFVPVLFSLLVATNLIVWSNSRVNYVFIFGTCPARWIQDAKFTF
ncbi:SPX-domain-containing protein [Cylindrobasidium torrendii FP15055 ss-10]|uniref:SPX-domain-containing protein n=1 Tax=Cylindrobasidium torrendii FP15055 ss-10 TaxID=1314674 RepID=A0A0D7BKI2_9AGAR|nr:SPX-domain-containing protein [Cylindrobasidium torrendii FP15055 ss-10]